MPYYLVDISADADAADLLTSATNPKMVRRASAAGGAVTGSGAALSPTAYTLAGGDFIVEIDPTATPTIPASGWTVISKDVYEALELDIWKAYLAESGGTQWAFITR